MNIHFSRHLAGLCKPDPMKSPVRILGAAVVALVAPALVTLPAAADSRIIAKVETLLGSDTRLTLSLGSGYDEYRRGDYRRDLNQFGQTSREVRDLRRGAVKACRRAVRLEARHLGYDDVDIDDDQRVHQFGPRGFFVIFDEVEFEGRRRDVETRVSCEVRRGEVVSIEGIPYPERSKPPRRDW